MSKLGLIANVFVMVLLFPGCSYDSYIYVEMSSIAFLAKHGDYYKQHSDIGEIKYYDRDFPVKGHRIAKGAGTIIGIRHFSRGSIFRTDDEMYEKLTIMVPSKLGNSTYHYNLPSDEIILFYSKGLLAFMGSRNTCMGYGKKGKVTIDHYNDYMFIDIDVEVDIYASALYSRYSCGTIVKSYHGNVKKYDHNSITPWLGKESKDIIDEALP